MSISDGKQAIDMGYKPKFRQGLLIKSIQELAKTSNGLLVPCALRCTVKSFGLLQPYFGHLSCMPVVYRGFQVACQTGQAASAKST